MSEEAKQLAEITGEPPLPGEQIAGFSPDAIMEVARSQVALLLLSFGNGKLPKTLSPAQLQEVLLNMRALWCSGFSAGALAQKAHDRRGPELDV